MNTHRLDKDTDLLKLTGSAFGTQADSGMKGYLRLPINVPDGELPNTSWLLLLELTGKNHGLLPFEIAGDVVLGRGTEGDDAPDLDLTALNAYEMGVSRRHAMFRPTTNHLYLIDLGSTNGCTVNGLPTGKGAVALRRHDHITLGQLNMRVLTLERVLGTTDAAKQEQSATSAPNVIALPPTPEKPSLPMGVLTPPLEKRMPSVQKTDPTLPLSPRIEVPPDEKKSVSETTPPAAKTPDEPSKPPDTREPVAETKETEPDNTPSQTNKPPSTL